MVQFHDLHLPTLFGSLARWLGFRSSAFLPWKGAPSAAKPTISGAGSFSKYPLSFKVLWRAKLFLDI